MFEALDISYQAKNNFPFHKMRLFVPKQLNFKHPDIVQRLFPRASILFHNVGHQSQVPFNKNISGLKVSGLGQSKKISFLLFRQRLWESPGIQLQGVQQRTHSHPGCQHGHHLRCYCIRASPSFCQQNSPRKKTTRTGRIPQYPYSVRVVTFC